MKLIFNNPQETTRSRALSLALGVFTGILPIWGFQTLAAILLSSVFRLNRVLAVLGSQISIPPLIPLVLYLSIRMGALWFPGRAPSLEIKKIVSLKDFNHQVEVYLYGSISLALLAGVSFGLLAYLVLRMTIGKSIPGPADLANGYPGSKPGIS